MSGSPLIFLCHAKEDSKKVQEIYLELRAAGLRPWMDKPPRPFELEGILPGEHWNSRIRKEIRNSAYFIAFLSKKSVSKRGYVQREFRLALNMVAEMPVGQVFLIPVLLEDCDVPETQVDSVSLRDLQWIDLTKDGVSVLINLFRHDAENRQGLLQQSRLVLRPGNPEDFIASIG